MEIITILGVVIFILWLIIKSSSPNAKFEKANKFFKTQSYEQAIPILYEIIHKHPEALTKLAECKLCLGQKSNIQKEKLKLYQEIIELRKQILPTNSTANFDPIEAKALFEIASIRFSEANNEIEKINQNIQFIDTANKKGIETKFAQLKKRHFHLLADIYFKEGVAYEKTNQSAKAYNIYLKAKNFAEKSGNTTIQYNSMARMEVYKLIQSQPLDTLDFPAIEKANQSYQVDFYYRYAIRLIKEKQFSEAEKIITQHLKYESHPIRQLKQLLLTEQQNNLIRKVDELNNAIEKLYKNELSVKDIKVVYDNLDTTINEAKKIDITLSEQLSNIKPTLFNRLLSHYMIMEEYANAINLIQNLPRFWQKRELLKNFGICCYGFTSKGLLNEKNFRIVVSGWLTSVYSDKVILNSLEGTTWDDSYTFTLAEAIGSTHGQHTTLPDNVNYNEVSEHNISIGATQKELLQHFEALIHTTIQDASLSNAINEFYDEEKEAIENTINIINQDMFFATPYFAKNYGLNNAIIQALENNYLQYSNEFALEIGTVYIRNHSNSKVAEYARTKKMIKKLKNAISQEDIYEIKNLTTSSNKELAAQFRKLNYSIENTFMDIIIQKSAKNPANEKLIAIMEECILFSSSNEKLKYQYSNYVANYCIEKVNSGKMDPLRALTFMKSAYLYSPNNPRICKNFITLIRLNLLDIVYKKINNTNEIYKILDWVKNNISPTFKQNSYELKQARTDILQQLKSGGVDISLLDDSFFPSYGQTLTAEGEKLKKVLTYFKDLSNQIQTQVLPF